MGHVRDLPKEESRRGREHDFKPTYEILPGRKKVIDDLKRRAETADKVSWPPTRPRRRGDLLALSEILKKTTRTCTASCSTRSPSGRS